MRIGEVLKKARPRPEGPSYRRLSGEIDEHEYRRELDSERKRLGLPAIRTAKEEGSKSPTALRASGADKEKLVDMR